MSDVVKGFLTVLVVIVLATAAALLLNLAAGGLVSWPVAILIGAIFGLAYGLEAGILLSYNLGSPKGWLEVVVDLTWSLPNTLWGFVIGNIIFPIFANPSRDQSRDAGWVVYMPRSSSSTLGNKVFQTHGTLNIGGAAQHEKMHLLQARIFGPLFLPIYAVNYVLNFTLQGLWTITIGLLLWKLGARDTPYFRPADNSVVSGFFGWIYYATIFEFWAYSSGNP
jgi:hypothetical protein